MKSKRSRLALLGALTLALALTVGLVSGSVADAKKGKKKGGNSVSVTSSTATALPPTTPPPPTPADTVLNQGITSIPLTVGKKAKGKVVALDSISLTFTITGPARSGAGTANDVPAAASNVGLDLISPNGRDVAVDVPGRGDQNATTIGPVTVMTNSPFFPCDTNYTGTNGTTTFCDINDPDGVVRPPAYTGVIGESMLDHLGGVPAKGTWILRARNFSRMTPAAVGPVTLSMDLTQASSSGKK